ncbi:MAG: hypothetical protein ABEJ35_02150 [Halobacteriaceae archaeon]
MDGRSRPIGVLLLASTLGVVLMAGIVAAAAPLDLLWTGTAGGPGRDTAGDGAIAPNGDLLLTGTIETQTGSDAFLQRRTPNGSVRWTRQYGQRGVTAGSDVVALPGGGAVVLADRVGPDGDRDVVVRRVNRRGRVQWERQYGSARDETAYTLVKAGTGYAFAGFTASGGDGSLAAWVVRIGPAGEKRWSRTYGPGRVDAAYDLVHTGSGYLLAGVTTDGGTVLQSGDGWVASLSANGTVQWTRRYGGSGGDSLRAIVETPDGYAIAGFTTSYGNGTASAWLVVTDLIGRERWNRTYGAGGVTVSADLVRTAEGYLLLGEGARQADFDVEFRRIAESGEQVSLRTFGGSGEDGAGSLVIGDGRAYALGVTTTESEGPSDALIVAVTAPNAPPAPAADDGVWPALSGLLAGAILVTGLVVALLADGLRISSRRESPPGGESE